MSAHISVLLNESVDGCITQVDGVYVDGTFGRGGHSKAMLKKLGTNARLFGIDKDPVAIEVGKALEAEDSRFKIFHGSFAELKSFLAELEINKIDGLLLDLGVSSPQLDESERGFSFMQDGPLDMRMNSQAGISACEWVNESSLEDMQWVFKTYGEERFARRIAQAIIDARVQSPITRTLELAEIVKQANPAWEKHKHPATRVFQAIRIAVNRELDDLKDVLEQSIELIKAGGRLSVISFHSLEDRIVKRFIRDQERGRQLPPEIPIAYEDSGQTFKRIGKAIKATDEELDSNFRARSAVLRIAERVA